MDFRCQQFTPKAIVNIMLDILGYKENLYGKKILENSCGEGNILLSIVERYILDSKLKGYSNDDIKNGLENDIYGVELIKETYDVCINNLNNLTNRYDLNNIDWKIFNEDSLKYDFIINFDYVIGNPPYISYKNLDEEKREFLKTNFETCKLGKPDYCYAFIESAINKLNDRGKMVYLIPSSIFKNVFGKTLREMIIENLVEVLDYPNKKLFKNALTSSSIILIDRNKKNNNFTYKDMTNKTNYNIIKENLSDKWIFEENRNYDSVENLIEFEELFKARITIATQKNDVFVVNYDKKERLHLEEDILRNAISPRNMVCGKKEYIIFPYKFENNKLQRFCESELKNKYKNVYKYLLENKEDLEKRKADLNNSWFEYGRNQAISNMNKKKLVISTVITNKVNVYDLKSNDIPYSGIYITSNGEYSLEIAKKILESDKFLEYIKKIGTPASGSSLRITANDINRFKFVKSEYGL
ncbi:Eco57I restriction-modification methylase domain-containing protein [Clostridium perfringens]|uniref:HsdM family class I SAM-dependent methyltransferase n=1 Tax=Clostridium perfringens TaxID=1502 RepID=UPI00285A1A4F|nr:N-6 DNA methylase [Clostridium perfringens]MDM0633360.1 Eco57I restriction-modification methylase domain-containing protein [Clostridium perfringens]MDM0670559.1 Eco57I restriction-modification methylase domain-containing protein [Clostridium perfringens]MDM0719154.1 Eco57I restriction-modification methylase domain-containing protein [Clostridium perfringens]